MKKISSILLSILLIISITACNSKIVKFNESELMALARTQVADMVDGNFKSTANHFNSDVAKQLDEAGLKAAWESTVAKIGEYIGEYSLNGEASGEVFIVEIVEEYEQNGLVVTIVYDSTEKISGINLNYKPIEKAPVTTETFEERAVTIGDEFPLNGIFTVPKDTENPPVVLLVQGSGSTDMNSTIFANTPFQDIAYGLAEHGIATLRYNKRYYTYPEKAGELGADLTLEDEVLQDVQFAIELLSNETIIDNSAIYVLGHSLGGGLTPYIASSNENVKGIISMAGSLSPIYEISYAQNKAMEEEILNGEYDATTVSTLKTQMKQVEIDIEVLRGDLSKIPNNQILLGLYAGYQKSAKEYAGEMFIDKIKIPVLVLQGTADFQVDADVDYKLWETTLRDRKNAECKLYDGLNHLMMQTNGKQDVLEYEIKGTVSQEVIDDIADFVGR